MAFRPLPSPETTARALERGCTNPPGPYYWDSKSAAVYACPDPDALRKQIKEIYEDELDVQGTGYQPNDRTRRYFAVYYFCALILKHRGFLNGFWSEKLEPEDRDNCDVLLASLFLASVSRIFKFPENDPICMSDLERLMAAEQEQSKRISVGYRQGLRDAINKNMELLSRAGAYLNKLEAASSLSNTRTLIDTFSILKRDYIDISYLLKGDGSVSELFNRNQKTIEFWEYLLMDGQRFDNTFNNAIADNNLLLEKLKKQETRLRGRTHRHTGLQRLLDDLTHNYIALDHLLFHATQESQFAFIELEKRKEALRVSWAGWHEEVTLEISSTRQDNNPRTVQQ